MEICRLPTLWLKALNKHSITHIMYIEIEMLAAIKMFVCRKNNTWCRQGFKCTYAKDAHTHTDAHSLFLFCLLTVTPSSFSVYWQSLPLPFLFIDSHSLFLFCLLTVTPSSFSVYSQSLLLPFLFTDSHSLFLFSLLTVTPSSFSVYWQSLPFNFCLLTVTPF